MKLDFKTTKLADLKVWYRSKQRIANRQTANGWKTLIVICGYYRGEFMRS